MSKDVGTYDPRNQLTVGALLRYAQHKARCEWLQPMWHKGPCDCGFKELILALPEDLLKLLVETNDHVRATVEDMKVQQEEPPKKPKAWDPCGHNDDGTDYG